MFARQGLRASSLLGAAVVSAGVAFAGTSLYNTSPSIIRSAHADTPPGPKKVFPAPGFVELQLHSSEMVNHNVKKLKFKLPEDDAVTGLEPICKQATTS
jgi:cytochrome-b5 reductase